MAVLTSLYKRGRASFHYRWRNFMWQRARRRHSEVMVRTNQGRYVIPTCDGYIARDLFMYGQYHLDLIQSVNDILQLADGRSGSVLDVGANIGVVCIGLMSLGMMERAIAIEPEPYNFALLSRNLKLNGLEGRCLSLQVALADVSGQICLKKSATNLGDHRSSHAQVGFHGKATLVRGTTLDDIVRSNSTWCEGISLVWMDVQGFEGYVVRGGERFFSSGVPCVMEVDPRLLTEAGVERDEWASLLNRYWRHYYRMPDRRKRSIATIAEEWDSLVGEGSHGDILLTT